jgi:hypothetical protein
MASSLILRRTSHDSFSTELNSGLRDADGILSGRTHQLKNDNSAEPLSAGSLPLIKLRADINT